jgi:hypothetical protein
VLLNLQYLTTCCIRRQTKLSFFLDLNSALSQGALNVSSPVSGMPALKGQHRLKFRPVALVLARDLQPDNIPTQSAKAGGEAGSRQETFEQVVYTLWRHRDSPIGSPEQDWIEAEKK